jgi:hypothetical protein
MNQDTEDRSVEWKKESQASIFSDANKQKAFQWFYALLGLWVAIVLNWSGLPGGSLLFESPRLQGLTFDLR